MATKLAEIIENSTKIVFFGGAGVSTESGIPDFRSAGGLYSQELASQLRPEDILSHSFFVAHPDEFYAYYTANLLHPEAKPNTAHVALAALEKRGKLTSVITQNIDGLHQAAGSERVLELHGSTLRNYCMTCGKRYGVGVVLQAAGVPRCTCGGMIRPDVVLYEEGLDGEVMDAAASDLAKADTLIIGGTSLVVYPAAGLVRAFRGHTLVLINRDSTPYDSQADLVIHDPIAEALAEFIDA